MRFETPPLIPSLCFFNIPLNFPPSAVASAKACATISDEIAPLLISSLSWATDLPVVSDIVLSGLKPAFTICNKSWPMSFPVADICANARARELKRCASPIEISPICLSVGISLSASTPKPSKSCAPLLRSFSISGVSTANCFNSLKKDAAFSLFPRRTSKEIWKLSISPRTLTRVFPKSSILSIAK